MKFIQLLHRYLYGLKQSESMSYNQLRKYLLKEGYENDSICPLFL